MAIATPALLLALNTALQKNFQDGYEGMRAQSFYNRIATTVPSNTSSNTYSWLGDFPTMREWVGDRVLKDMKAQGYQITNRLFEATLAVQRTQIEDDQYGHYTPTAVSMGQEAMQHPDKLLSALLLTGETALCYDGQFFFDIDHPVYANVDGTGAVTTWSNFTAGANPRWYLLDTRKALRPLIFQERTKPELEMKMDPKTSDAVFTRDQYQWGIRYRCEAGFGFPQLARCSRAALTQANFEAERALMRGVKADGGRPLGIAPNVLMVGPSLESAARTLIETQNLANGASNPLFRNVEVLVNDWIE